MRKAEIFFPFPEILLLAARASYHFIWRQIYTRITLRILSDIKRRESNSDVSIIIREMNIIIVDLKRKYVAKNLLINPLVFRYKRYLFLWAQAFSDQRNYYRSGRCRSLVVGGSLRLQQTLTSCVAPLEEFTSLRQPVKGGNTTLITISRTQLLHETTRCCIHPGPRGSARTPFFLDLRIILPSSTTLRQFRMKQDVRRAITGRESLWEFSEYCVAI